MLDVPVKTGGVKVEVVVEIGFVLEGGQGEADETEEKQDFHLERRQSSKSKCSPSRLWPRSLYPWSLTTDGMTSHVLDASIFVFIESCREKRTIFDPR